MDGERAALTQGFHPLEEASAEPVPVRQALGHTISLVETLHALHQNGHVHLAVDLRHVEIDASAERARLASSTRSQRLPPGGMLPPPSGLRGDPRCIAPEQTGRIQWPVDERADLYSAGIVLYRLLTGRLPFHAEDPTELVHAHLARRPRPPAELQAGIPEALSGVVLRLLAKDPDDRYQSAAGLLADLRLLLRSWTEDRSLSDFAPGREDIAPRFQVSRQLVGREDELAVLLAATERAGWGESSLVLVKGPPGVGKSVLIGEVRKVASRRGAVISGKYEQYRRNVAYFGIVAAFQELVERLLVETDSEIESWRNRLLTRLGSNVRLIIDIIPELVHITGPQPDVPALPPEEERNRFNRVFRDFVAIFASAEHPLALLLDDLQWADTASLSLIEMLLNDSQLEHLLILAAYRDSEVDRSHPMSLMVASLSDAGLPPTELCLHGLSVHKVGAILAASLNRSEEDCVDLARLLWERTAGNPFYLGQFLRTIHERELFRYDPDDSAWHWNVAQIEAESFPVEAFEFVIHRIETFAETTRTGMMTAACVGAVFRTETLASVLDESPDETRIRLAPAVRAGLIEPRGAGYAFAHDRIQQAAFGLIPEDELVAFRYTVGRRVVESLSDPQLEETLFELLDNLNNAVGLELPQAERSEIARLNLTAGRRARTSLAYDDAVRLFRTGIELLPSEPWQTDYELTFGLHRNCFECEYLSGQFEAALNRYEALLTESRDKLDAARIYYTRVLLETSRGNYQQAVATGLEALQQFNVALPQQPRSEHVLWELAKAGGNLRLRRIESLVDLPELNDAELEMVTQLLLSFCPAAYFHNPDVMTLAALRIVNLSLRKGNTPAASFGYVLMALVLSSALQRYRSGHAFGQLAVKLAERAGDIALRSKVVLIFGGFVEFWTQPVDQAVTRLKDGFRISLDAGDNQYADYCALQIQFLSFFRGERLDACRDTADRYADFIRHTRDTFSINSSRALYQTILALQGETRAPGELTSDDWVEADEEALIREMSNPTALFYFRVWKLQLCYHFGRLEEAQALARTTAASFDAAVSQISQVEQTLYAALVAAALLQSASPDGAALRRQLRLCQRRLARWAKVCPENFAPASLLVDAEAAALRSGGDQTMRAFDRAIDSARAKGFVNLQALANERAAAMYERTSRPAIAQAYLREAVSLYDAWGAGGKVQQLSEQAGLTPAAPPNLELVREDGAGDWAGLDVNVVIRGTRAVADQTQFDRLLAELVRVTLEVAGAERCVVLLDEVGEGFRVQAQGTVDDPEPAVLLEQPLDDQADVCVPIVLYAARTERALTVDDARRDERFRESPYVRRHAPVSVLALPLKHHGRVTGVVYLENNLVAQAFSPSKLKGLEIICAETAMAIENVGLKHRQSASTQDLQNALRRVDSLQQAKVHLSKFVPQSVQRIIDENPLEPALGKTARDASILFMDIAGYTRMTEALDASRIDYLIERYFSAFLGDIHANGGDINETSGDGLMILFLDDDPVEHARQAARTALAIRRTTRAINAEVGQPFEPVVINMGISSGSALVGSTRLESTAGTRYTYTATGMPTILAARIAASAVDGEILISGETADRLGGDFALRDVGAREYKNVSLPVQVFSLVN